MTDFIYVNDSAQKWSRAGGCRRQGGAQRSVVNTALTEKALDSCGLGRLKYSQGQRLGLEAVLVGESIT